jgi:hypothetical protein
MREYFIIRITVEIFTQGFKTAGTEIYRAISGKIQFFNCACGISC